MSPLRCLVTRRALLQWVGISRRPSSHHYSTATRYGVPVSKSSVMDKLVRLGSFGNETSRRTSEAQRSLTDIEGQKPRPRDVSGQSPTKLQKSRDRTAAHQVFREPQRDKHDTKASESADSTPVNFSPLVLRDICACPKCVDPSSKQRLFSTFDIPDNIKVKTAKDTGTHVEYTWENDIDGYNDHTTVISKAILDKLSTGKSPVPIPALPQRTFWNDRQYRTECRDLDFKSYMHDDQVLYRALCQLQIHGLLFLTDVPSSPDSVSQIANRIGPLKNTFYGKTWDVRSVPEAKNVAYTSQDLGFHMDLLYMKQPPHLQFLHCIRSSANGGASLFMDSFRAASDLYETGDPHHFNILSKLRVTHHYNHLDSHLYEQTRPTIELEQLGRARKTYKTLAALQGDAERRPDLLKKPFDHRDFISGVSWAPPFQAPFRMDQNSALSPPAVAQNRQLLNNRVESWHRAAKAFNQFVQKEDGIHERVMKPGECVLFDNRRVLHARRAFEVGDQGSERWLRGAYLDRDPFVSKLRVLMNRFGDGEVSSDAETQRSALDEP